MSDLERTLDRLWEEVLKKHAMDTIRELEAQPSESIVELLGKMSLSINTAVVHLLVAEMYVHSWLNQIRLEQESGGETEH